jgi:hypothetical protein
MPKDGLRGRITLGHYLYNFSLAVKERYAMSDQEKEDRPNTETPHVQPKEADPKETKTPPKA